MPQLFQVAVKEISLRVKVLEMAKDRLTSTPNPTLSILPNPKPNPNGTGRH